MVADAICDGGGRPLPVLANIMVALRAASQIENAFNFDEMLRAPILMRALPMVRRLNVDLGPYPDRFATPMYRSCKIGCSTRACQKSA